MEQARITGKYLQTLSQEGLKIGTIIHSGMLRAEQTAIAINKELNEQKDLETFALLNEGSLANIEVSKLFYGFSHADTFHADCLHPL